MRLLAAVEGSVLWLLRDDADTVNNLKGEAARRGIDPARLVFAERRPADEHLARHRAADLFLDTLPYNAHTTAADALWAGLPVLTCPGDTFAGRVAASMLHAIGLAELVAPSLDAYEQSAINLATNPDRLPAIRARLAQNRRVMPLFDTARFTRRMEAAYTAMHARQQAGLPPDHIAVKD
jgi:predicted O-linked N-acetylglucosamine transferase (SPINDLY family)